MLEWIFEEGEENSCIGILDATNTTKDRRRLVLERCRAAAAEASQSDACKDPPPLRVLFMESICDDPSILEGNYQMKMVNADYSHCSDKQAALEDFKKRVVAYEEQYEPLEEEEVAIASTEDDVICGAIRIINGGRKLSFNNLGCSMVSMSLCSLLSCFHLAPRKLYLVSEAAVDASQVAMMIRDFERADENKRPVDVLCRASNSTIRMVRQVETFLEGDEDVRPHRQAQEDLRHSRGIVSLRSLEPKTTRAPGTSLRGETFGDLALRMLDVLLMIERLPRSILVLYPEEDVLRVLLAHFHGCPQETDLEDMELPEGPAVELSRDHKGFRLRELTIPEGTFSVASDAEEALGEDDD
jgi:hypothetical protein